jgi:hypothetical protein
MHSGCANMGNLPLTDALPQCPTVTHGRCRRGGRRCKIVVSAQHRGHATRDSAAVQCAERNPMLKYLLPAAVASLLACSAVSAAPVSAPTTSGIAASTSSSVVDVRDHRRAHRGYHRSHRHRGYRGRYHPGRRYRHAPYGYRRYSSRPYNWRSRGCVIVGPLWFCP